MITIVSILMFGIGAGTGILVGGLLTTYLSNLYLVLKSEKNNRTALCINGKFYYIMPEEEYIRVDTYLAGGSQEITFIQRDN